MSTFKKPSKLLSTNNAKTLKGNKKGYTTYILYLSPFNNNSKGINLCSHASDGCAKACLFNSGRGGMDKNVSGGRLNKTEYFLSNRQEFLMQLHKELTLISIKHKKDGSNFAVRLNGTSDIRFEKFKYLNGKNVYELFPNIQFYDYTKNPIKIRENKHSNYHLTFSRSENNDNVAYELLSEGFNVAMVFDEKPSEFNGFNVIDGDETDLTFTYPSGNIIGLKFKKLTFKGANNKQIISDSDFVIKTKVYV